MKSIKLLVMAFACCLFAANPGHAQGVGASGEIKGTVTDPSGAVVPRANITAVETDRGIQHTTVSDASGEYQLTGLPATTYSVSAQITGFEAVTQKGVTVNVGVTSVLDFHLKVAAAGQTVEITAEAPTVETERSSQANTLTPTYITNLPIDRRDYLTFTLLLPGVSNSTRLADDQDFRVKQTPQSGLSFYGSNGRGNSVTVDGGETSGDSGGVRLTVSQDAVNEFQVNRSNYGADLGGATGASINIVSKSGTNNLHGSVYGYFRNDAMDAQDPFAFSQALTPTSTFAFNALGHPVKNSLNRQQYGGSIGGPIKKDKTFLFFSFEGLRQNSQNAVPLLTDSSIFLGPNAAAPVTFAAGDPRAAQQSIVSALVALPGNPVVPCFGAPPGPVTLLPAQTCAGALSSALTISPVTGLTPLNTGINNYLINQLETNGGLFNYNTRQYLFSGRLDHRINDANQISFTYRFGHDLEENPDVQSLTGFSAGSAIHNYDHNFQGAWYHQFSPVTQNELRVQWDYNSFNVIPNEPGQVGIQIAGFANNLGTNIFLPNFTILRRTEIADNVTLVRGHHTMKFGGSELLRGNHSESHTFFPGRFVFGQLPGAAVSLCFLPSATMNPCGLTTAGANVTSLQSASLSAPQVYQQGFGNPDYPAYTRPLTGFYWQDSWAMMSNFKLTYGLRYEIDGQFKPLNTYYGDFAPRVSFAWDPFKDHKTVIRGGYGIFYGPVDAQIPQVDLSLGVLNKDRSTVENQHNTAQVPNQVNNAVLTCGVGVTAFGPPGIIVPGTGASPCNRFISIYVDPGFATALPFLKTAGQVFGTLFGQGLIQCTTPTAGNAACITPASVAPLGIFVQNSGQLAPLTVLFSNPPTYKPPYSQQASFGIEREIATGLSISASFVYSHTLRLPVAIDTNLLPSTPKTTVTLANGKQVSYRNWYGGTPPPPPGGPAPGDPLFGTEFPGFLSPCANPSACFVNPLIIQNNQYTSAASALYEGGIFEVKYRLGTHYTLFGNYTFSKGFDTSTDFNTDYGPQDPTDLRADRGLSEFDERHKVVIAGVFDSPWTNAFLSGFQLAPIFTYRSGHPFNLLVAGAVNGNNHITNERPIGAPRDTGLGPNYYDFDMRLSWHHKLGEKANIQLTAEGFNLANRTNFGSVNNEVSPLFGLPATGPCTVTGLPCGGGGHTTFNVHGIRGASPSTPLAFTSALPKREIQLGLRVSF
jgi:hypothetical protein